MTDASAAPIAFNQSHGVASAGKCAANEASDGGRAKKWEAFTRSFHGEPISREQRGNHADHMEERPRSQGEPFDL